MTNPYKPNVIYGKADPVGAIAGAIKAAFGSTDVTFHDHYDLKQYADGVLRCAAKVESWMEMASSFTALGKIGFIGSMVAKQLGKQALKKGLKSKAIPKSLSSLHKRGYKPKSDPKGDKLMQKLIDKGEAVGIKPILGRNPNYPKTRTNTDLLGGKPVAKSIFRNQSKGKKAKDIKLRDPESKGRITKDQTVAIRHNKDGSTRIDLKGRGPRPNGETIHFD